MIPVRFRYVLEELHNPPSFADTVLTSAEVDPNAIAPEVLSNALSQWAAAELSARKCEFGLYIAEFGAWDNDNVLRCSVRMLYIMWFDEPVAIHAEDNAHGITEVNRLLCQAETNAQPTGQV